MQASPSGAEVLSGYAVPVPCVPIEMSGMSLDRIDMGWCEYRFSGATASRTARILELCDGGMSIEKIAARLGAPPGTVAATVTALYVRGIVRDSSQQNVPATTFQRHLVSAGRTLRTAMSADADLLGGQLHRRRLLGSLVETFHFVSAASYHIGAAVAHTASPEVRDSLSTLFNEESKHGRGLRGGLLAAGLDDATIRRSRPLPGTLNVVNFLRALAATDLLSYAVCAAVNESPKTDTAIKEGWDAIIALDLLPADALVPFRGHELEDEDSGHAAIADVIFAERTTLGSAEQRRIQGDLESFIAVQRSCYQEMKEFYSAPDGPAAWGL